jgi:hypothetical protein
MQTAARTLSLIGILLVVALIAGAVGVTVFVRNARNFDVNVKVVDNETGAPVSDAKVILTVEHFSPYDTNTKPARFGGLTDSNGLIRFHGTAPFIVGRLYCEAIGPNGMYNFAVITDETFILRLGALTSQQLSNGEPKDRYTYDHFEGTFVCDVNWNWNTE